MAGIDKFTKLLVHFDGENNGTTFTDSSVLGKTVTRVGGAITKTDQFKFGGSSGYFDGNGDYVYTSDSSEFTLGTNNFTVDAWIKVTSTSGDYVICGQYGLSNAYWKFSVVNYNLAFYGHISGGVLAVDVIGTGNQLNDDAWHHVAAVRNGTGANSLTLYIDGVAIAVTTTVDLASNSIGDFTGNFFIGSITTTKYFLGYIDELRFSVGVARWTANFTPPTEAYSRVTTWYLDAANGSDSAIGDSWATAWKTIGAGCVQYAVIPGDTVKIAKSPDPVSIGNTAWTDLGTSVTLAAPLTLGIDQCESGWTASANVTITYDNTDYKQGTKSTKLAAAPAFTTGKIGYKTIPETDYSAFQAITFWLKYSPQVFTVLPHNTVKVCLCSDISGETIVDSFYVPGVLASGSFSSALQPLLISKGSALGSSIKSVALYIETDLTPTYTLSFYLDNIQACNDFGIPSLISKNTVISGEYEPWWAIQSISGETVYLARDCVTSGAAPSVYLGTTETVESYYRNVIQMERSTDFTLQVSGTLGNKTIYEGGWDTGTDLQDGETFICGRGIFENTFYSNQKDYWEVNNLSVIRSRTPLYILQGYDSEFNALQVSNGSVQCMNLAGYYPCVVNINNATCCHASYQIINFGTAKIDLVVGNVYVGGVSLIDFGNNSYGNNITFSKGRYATAGIVVKGQLGRIKGGTISNVTTGISTSSDTDFENYLSNIIFEDCTNIFSNNGGNIGLHCYNFDIGAINPLSGTFAPGDMTGISMTKVNGDINDNRFYSRYFTVLSEQSVRHTASGVSWKLSILSSSAFVIQYPAVIKLGKVAVNANAQVTISCWMRRTNVGLSASLFLREYQIAGVTSDVETYMTAIADTWEQVSIQFTPTEAGVVEFEVHAYGGTTYSLYIDDVEIT